MKKLISSIVILSVLLFILLPSGFLFGQEGKTLSIKEVNYDNFPEVDIYFSVFDQSGLPIEDLKSNDFEIKDEDIIIEDYELESIINTDSPSYIALLLDTSGSMKGDPLAQAKIAAIDFVKSLKDIDEVKIFVFNDEVKYIQDFTTDKNSLINAINSVETEGTKTLLNFAVFEAAKDLDEKPLGNRVIVLLTDGKDEGASIAIEDAIGKAIENKIPIYSVGFGKNFNEENKDYDEEANEALSRFSILTNGKFFIAQEEEDLAYSFNKISDILKYQYHLKYTSTLPKDGNEYETIISIISFDEVLKDSFTITTPTFEMEVNLDQIEDEIEIEQLTTITPNISITPEKFLLDNEIEKVEYYLDSDATLITETSTPPYSLDFDPEGLDYGKHNIIVKVYDSIGRIHEFIKPIVIPTSPDRTILYYYIGGGVLAIIIIAIVLALVLKRRRKRKAAEVAAADQISEIGEGGLIEEDSGSTWIDDDEAFKSKEVGLIGSETIIRKAGEFIPNAWLTVVKGSHEGEDYSIPPEDDPEKRKITIGRNSYHDVVIDDESTSREHAYIIIEKNNYKIGDMGSSNGTFLNDKKISTPRILKDGDRIDIGDTELVFKALTFKKDKKLKVKKKAKKPKKTG